MVAAAQDPALHPALAELIALRAALPTALPSAQRAFGLRAGRHVALAYGRGLEFAGLRPYQSGDDLRSLDWRHTARHGRPFTKLFHEERERPVQLLADLGPTLQYATRGVFKCIQVARVAALLAWAAIAAGDRVGGLVRRVGELQTLPPTAREAGAMALLRALAAPASREAGETPPLHAAIERLLPTLRPGSELFIVSDFTTLDSVTERALTALRRAQRLTLLRIADPLELAPPPPGRYPLADDGGSGILDLRTTAARETYASGCAARTAQFTQLARRLGAAQLTLTTDSPPHAVLALWRPRA